LPITTPFYKDSCVTTTIIAASVSSQPAKNTLLFFDQSNGHVFQTMRTKPRQESGEQRSDLDAASFAWYTSNPHCSLIDNAHLAAILIVA
jgi:hypothetical protein